MSQSEKKKKRRRGGDICSLLFCSNPRTDSISLHQAPKDPEIRKKWFNFVAKTRQNISDLKTFHICSDHFTDADYLIPPVVAASSDVKFKRILNRNAVPSIYPSPTFDKVKSKQSEYEVVKKSGVKLPPFAKPSYALVDVDVKMKDSIKRRRKKTVDKLSLSRVSQSFTDLSFWLDFSSF